VKYADDLVLLTKKEMVLQGGIGRLTEIGRSCGMKMNVEKPKVIRISRQPIPRINNDRSKAAGECGLFQLFV
jgi:hypothetical protein